MTENNVAGPTTGSGWPFWDAAVQRFTLGYGDPPDFNDPDDMAAFIPLVYEAASDAAGAELVAALERGVDRLREGLDGDWAAYWTDATRRLQEETEVAQ